MGTHIVLFLKPINNINFNKLATDMYNNYPDLTYEEYYDLFIDK